MRIKWDKKTHRFSFQGKGYVLDLSKPSDDYCWYAKFRRTNSGYFRGLGHYTTTAHAVRSAKRTLKEKEKEIIIHLPPNSIHHI